MKKTLGITSLMALITVCTPQFSPAQTATGQTNVTLDLDFNLVTISEGTTTTNDGVIAAGVKFGRITEQIIIQDLGKATSNMFSSDAELLLQTPTNDPNDWTVLVRDGSNMVDVTGFFGHTPGTNTVGSTYIIPKTEDVFDTEYAIDSFSVHGETNGPALSTHFHVSGLTVTSSRGIVITTNGPVGITEQFNANVSGTGESDGDLILVEGSITAHGNNLAPRPVSPASGVPSFGQ